MATVLPLALSGMFEKDPEEEFKNDLALAQQQLQQQRLQQQAQTLEEQHRAALAREELLGKQFEQRKREAMLRQQEQERRASEREQRDIVKDEQYRAALEEKRWKEKQKEKEKKQQENEKRAEKEKRQKLLADRTRYFSYATEKARDVEKAKKNIAALKKQREDALKAGDKVEVDRLDRLIVQNQDFIDTYEPGIEPAKTNFVKSYISAGESPPTNMIRMLWPKETKKLADDEVMNMARKKVDKPIGDVTKALTHLFRKVELGKKAREHLTDFQRTLYGKPLPELKKMYNEEKYPDWVGTDDEKRAYKAIIKYRILVVEKAKEIRKKLKNE